MGETNLRNALLLREKWFGKNHPLVGDILFVLGQLMSDEYNDKGYVVVMQCVVVTREVVWQESSSCRGHLAFTGTVKF